jgi:hypothetical protein
MEENVMVGYEQLVRVRFLYCLFSAVAAELHKHFLCFLNFCRLGHSPGAIM